MENSHVTLRAHHVETLVAYSDNPKLSDNEARYGKNFVKNTINVFNRILTGQTAVTIIDDFDDLCKVCTEKVEDGCGIGGNFNSAGKGANYDKKCAKDYNLELGKTYDGLDFLERLGLAPIKSPKKRFNSLSFYIML